MPIILYSERQIGLVRAASKIVADCHEIVRQMAKPGATTAEIDKAVAEKIAKEGATSAFLGYRQKGMDPFPGTTCMSPNDVVVHGVPGDEPLKEGDILSVDIGVKKDGYIGDSAWTYPIGKIDEKAQALLEAGEKCLRDALETLKPRSSLFDLCSRLQKGIEEPGFSVVRELCGHGVGGALHEEPPIFNFVPPVAYVQKELAKIKFKPGMVVAIEPMLNEGGAQVKEDGWPVRTADGKRSAHFEHTVAILPSGVDVLTIKAWEQPFVAR